MIKHGVRMAVLALMLASLLPGCATAKQAPSPTLSLPHLLTIEEATAGSSAAQLTGEDEILAPIAMHVGTAFGYTWFQAYFTDPSSFASRQYSGGADGPLVAAIDAARLSVDAAMFSLTLNSVRNALIRANRRGVAVRVVMESDNLGEDDPQSLMRAGITVLGDRQEGLMHDKFMVIDGSDVWTGSMNFTNAGAYLDNNVLLHIRSEMLASDYEAEFDKMFVGDLFGPARGSAAPAPEINVGGTSLQVYFAPENHVQDALVQLIKSAKTSIYFLAFSFTSDPLGQALRQQASAGVKVAGVMDADQAVSNLGTEYDAFRADGLAVRLDGNPGQMHEKLIIIDGETVVVGSYNFSRSADTANDENLLVIRDQQIAGQCVLEFTRVFDKAQR